MSLQRPTPPGAPPPPPLGWQLKRQRITRGALAAEVGCSEDMIAKLITGRRRGSAAMRARISEVLGLPERELFDPEATITVTPRPERARAS
jgi:transcriptional regulator with XRE-family HTH domain